MNEGKEQRAAKEEDITQREKFSREELQKASKGFQAGKAPGFDGPGLQRSPQRSSRDMAISITRDI